MRAEGKSSREGKGDKNEGREGNREGSLAEPSYTSHWTCLQLLRPKEPEPQTPRTCRAPGEQWRITFVL